MIFLSLLIFIISLLVMFISSPRLVGAIIGLARFLGWREFVVAFFVVAVAASFPNLFVGINSALKGIPQLALGDVVGGNVVDLTIAIGLAVLLNRARTITVESRMVQISAIFTALIAVLPLLLLFDSVLSRGDGLVLIFAFLAYIFWVFSKKDRFTKIYNHKEDKLQKGVKSFLRSLAGAAFYLVLLIGASRGMVESAELFSKTLDVSLAVVGIFIVGTGNSLPEIYFALASARKRQNWMILGDLMGAVIVPATLVLGIVAIISPFEIPDISPFAIARIFLIISSLIFLIAVRTGRRITKKEGLLFLLLYVVFLITEIVVQ